MDKTYKSNNNIEDTKNKYKKTIEELINENKIKEAEYMIDEYGKRIKDDIDIISIKAVAYILEGKLFAAENIINDGLKSDNKNFDLIYNKAYIFMLKNEINSAVRYYNMALKFSESDEISNEIKKTLYILKNKTEEKSKKKKIVIGSPIHQKPEILKEFLNSLQEINAKEFEVYYIFIDDNENIESSKLLNEFSGESGNVMVYKSREINTYRCDNDTHHWNENLIWKVANFKDKIINNVIDLNYDYLFLIDSDLVIHPNIINELISTEKDIISNIFWSKWKENQIQLPQVWISDTYNQYFKRRDEIITDEEMFKRQLEFINMLKTPGVYEVGGLGACTLISRKALKKGVNFKEIKNISFVGEDRHFCIRAQALGFDLYVDTHYPAYHIYREKDLNGILKYKEKCYVSTREESQNIKKMFYQNNLRVVKEKGNKITLSMVVKDEADNYLFDMLKSVVGCIDEAVIIDDGSTDNTVNIIKDVLKDIPLHIVRNSTSKFSNEILLRKQQWNETIKTNPDWILFLDADQLLEKRFKNYIRRIINQTQYDVISFRLYDFWNESMYREDKYWSSHKVYRPFLIRYQKYFNYVWRETPQHCGSFPMNILELPATNCNLRIKHLGWSREEDRKQRYKRYLRLDPKFKYGVKEQTESILDENPNLVLWEE